MNPTSSAPDNDRERVALVNGCTSPRIINGR